MRAVKPRRVLATTSLALCVATTACSGEAGSPVDDGHEPIPALNAVATDLLPTDAAALPEFDVARFDALLEQLVGTPVVVNVWGSWCDPCRDEARDLVEAHERHGREVQFLGIDILDARESARAFQRRYAVTYPSVFDPPGRIRDGLGLLGQPATLFYDRSGTLVSTWTGAIPADELNRRIHGLNSPS